MEKKHKPVAPWGLKGKKKRIKLITFLICIILIFINIVTCFVSPLTIGYKYYDNTIQIGETQQKDLFAITANNYLHELEENGYNICSTGLNRNIIYRLSIIHRDKINDEQLTQDIKDSIDVKIFAYKVIIENDDNVYYFKTESECNKFISDLKEYNKDIVVTVVANEIIDIHNITSVTVLQEKIESLRLEYEQKEKAAAQARIDAAIAARKAQTKVVSSRSGEVVRDVNNNKSQHPLNSYTYISSKFGQRSRGFHTGVDFATPTGTAVHAWKAGKVIRASWSGGYGNYVQIQHSDGTISCYAHLSKYACTVGQSVACHQVIAYSGSTGNSTGPHVHFEIKVNGNFVNPLNYL